MLKKVIRVDVLFMCNVHDAFYTQLVYSHCTIQNEKSWNNKDTQKGMNVNGKVSFICKTPSMRKHYHVCVYIVKLLGSCLDYYYYCLVSNYIFHFSFQHRMTPSNLNFILISKSQKTNNLNERLFHYFCPLCYSKRTKIKINKSKDSSSQSVIPITNSYINWWGLSMWTRYVYYHCIFWV